MSHNTIYSIQAILELRAEPATGGTPGKAILTKNVALPITADVCKGLFDSNTINYGGRSFKIGQLHNTQSPYRLECEGVGYLSPECRTDNEIMDGLIHSGWRIADPSDVRKHGYAISRSLLEQFEIHQAQQV
jgi:hypothetical protein